MTIQRYSVEPWDIRRADMKRDQDGDYVSYDDHTAEVARLTAERDAALVKLKMAWVSAVAIEPMINEPPRNYDIEPIEVRDYRHSLYPLWSKLVSAISPPPKPTTYATVTVQDAAKVLLAQIPNPIFDELKPVLMGEFTHKIRYISEDGDEKAADDLIEWTTTKEIITAALRAIAEAGE